MDGILNKFLVRTLKTDVLYAITLCIHRVSSNREFILVSKAPKMAIRVESLLVKGPNTN